MDNLIGSEQWGQILGFLEAIGALNRLKREGIFKDYAIGGGCAVNYYLEPSLTYDLEILVLLDSGEDYHALYRYFKEKGNRIENIYIIIDDMPVRFLPGYISPLFAEAIKKARKITIRGVPSKVVRVEHLIALLLISFRPKDRIRIIGLLESVDRRLLERILGRFEDEETPLRQRFKRILASL